jgi:hypothetical protein
LLLGCRDQRSVSSGDAQPRHLIVRLIARVRCVEATEKGPGRRW